MRHFYDIKHVVALLSRATYVVALAAVFALSIACSSDDADEKSKYTQGVILPTQTSLSCDMGASDINISISTNDGYTIDTDNPDMIKFTSGASASQGGTYTVKIAVKSNPKEQSRTAGVFIQVKGNDRIKLVDIKQSALVMHPLVEWIDHRLSTEYYWLDEYNEKRHTFDFTLPYDNFLDTSLKSLTTNYDDGKVYEDGSRSLYSYISKIDIANIDSDGTMREETMGFGISIMPLLMRYSGSSNAACMKIEHVYPGSVADNAGMKRGDTIIKVNNESLPLDNIARINELFYMVQYNSVSSVSIEYIPYSRDGLSQIKTATLTADYFIENPVAFCDVLTIPEDWGEGMELDRSKKVGYISYLQFDFNHEKRLVEAISELSTKGVTDLILDLRTNSGGNILSCISLASMIIGEEHVGQPFMQFTYNPKRNIEPETHSIISNGYEQIDMGTVDLPNLNMNKVYIITSSFSSSASESLIVGLVDLGIDVVMIGKTTDGKNCGMETTMGQLGNEYYMLAPITFMTASGKGFHDYGDGIKPGTICKGTDFEKYANSSSVSSAVSSNCDRFPLPDFGWADVEADLALVEALAQIFGYTVVEAGNVASSQLMFGNKDNVHTRSGVQMFEPLDITLKTRKGGIVHPTNEIVKIMAE